jgi:hypothetical protein
MAINPAQLAYLRWLFEQEATREDNISTYRDYYDGDQGVVLTERQSEYLEEHAGEIHFCLNLCQVVVDSLVDRLRLTGFRVSEPPTAQDDEPPEPATPMLPGMPGATPEPEEPKAPDASEVVNEWWQDNKGDGLQRTLHKAACRDGDSYLIVDWDAKKGRPSLNFQPAYTCYGGNPANGTGVKVHYGDAGEIICASKRWKVDSIEAETGAVKTIRRLNLYFDERIEKYQSDSDDYEGNWQEWYDETPENEGEEVETAWPMPWVDEAGEPLGIPVFHFKNCELGYPYGESELKVVIPLQQVLNKVLVDMIADADYSAFRVWTQSGGEQPDGAVFPGAFLWNGDPTTKWSVVDGAGSERFINAMDAIVRYAAAVSRTPQYLFYPTGTMPSGESMKTAESGLVMKVRDRIVGFGSSYEAAMQFAIKLANVYGEGVDMPDGALISSTWESADQQTEAERLGRAEFMLSNGYEQEALRLLGYDDAEIEKLIEEKQEASAQKMTEGAVWAMRARAQFEQGGGPQVPGQFGGQFAANSPRQPAQFGAQPAQPQPGAPQVPPQFGGAR